MDTQGTFEHHPANDTSDDRCMPMIKWWEKGLHGHHVQSQSSSAVLVDHEKGSSCEGKYWRHAAHAVLLCPASAAPGPLSSLGLMSSPWKSIDYACYAYQVGTAVLVFACQAWDALDAHPNHASAHVPVWWSRALLHCENTHLSPHNAAQNLYLWQASQKARSILCWQVLVLSQGIHECTEAGQGQPKMPLFDRSAFLRASLVSTWNQSQVLCEVEQSACMLDKSSAARPAPCMRLHCRRIEVEDAFKHFQACSQACSTDTEAGQKGLSKF